MLRTIKVTDGVLFQVKALPKSARAGISSMEDGILKIKLTSPPVKGAANDQCLKLLAKALGVGKTNLSITEGHKSRNKWIKVKNLDESTLKKIINRLTR